MRFKNRWLDLNISVKASKKIEYKIDKSLDANRDDEITEFDRLPRVSPEKKGLLLIVNILTWLGSILTPAILYYLALYADRYPLVSPIMGIAVSIFFAFPIILVLWSLSIILHNGRGFYMIPLLVISFCVVFIILEFIQILNGSLDSSPPTTHIVSILEKYKSHSDSGYDHFLVVSSWRENEIQRKIWVKSRVYQKIKPGQSTMTITTRPGKFGLEWKVETKYNY